MIKELDITKEAIAQKVINLQRLAYQVEADLIESNDIPYLSQGLSNLMRSTDETFVGYFDDENRLMGVFSFKIANHGVLDVHRFMVHPSLFRQGIASQIFDFVKANYKLRRIIAQTGVKNKPAYRFYVENGIDYVCNIQVNRKVELATFAKDFMTLEEFKAENS